MPIATLNDIGEALAQLQQQLAALTARIERMEGMEAAAAPPVPAPQVPPVAAVAAPPPAPAAITEEEILAISAALGAYLGVRVHIRQIRLASSRAWAQEGRVSIQASHRLHS